MHPQERELISSMFDRLAPQAAAPRDPEAEALIAERARALPNAVYALAQTACLQDIALRQAQARIAELEQQLAARPTATATATAGSFLGAAPVNPWGAARTSVPPTASPYQPQQPAYAPQPGYAAPPQQSWGMPPAGGGFLRGVAGTALGVAGGALLAEGISSLFSGHHAGFGTGLGGMGLGGVGGALAADHARVVEPARVVENVTVNNYYGDGQPADASDDTGDDDSAWPDDGSGNTDGSVDF